MKTNRFINSKRKIYKVLLLSFILIMLIGMVSLYLNPPDEAIHLDAISSSNPPKISELQKNSLPIIIIDTDGQDIEGNMNKTEVEINGVKRMVVEPSSKYNVEFKLYEPNFYGYTSISENAVPTVKSDMVMNVRGQSSLMYDKKQYTIRLIDEYGLANSKPLLGMKSHDKWVLNGMYSDKSLMRNHLAYKMGRQIMEYSPDTRFVEVYLKNTKEDLNYEDHYIGIYLLTEKIERDQNRVNIDKNNDKYRDVSFIISRDKIKNGDIVLRSDWNTLEEDFIIGEDNVLRAKTVFTTTYPSKSNMTDLYQERIVDYINKFEYSLRSSNFQDRELGYKKYIDVDSFIKYAMINEITKNIDGGEVSAYFYKDIGGLLKAGPIWDFDQSLGNTNILEIDEPTGFRMVNVIWYERLFQDEDFANRYKNMYRKYRNTIWSDSNIDKLIDETLLVIGPSVDRNREKWYPKDTGEDYYKEVESIRNFLKERFAWMDKNIHLINRIKENAVE